ncbi:MAG: EcoRI family type II restriction endonuclease [Pseudomonadota bacterium]
MGARNTLRKNSEQHKPKNTKSKVDDKRIYRAMELVIEYLKERFPEWVGDNGDYDLKFSKEITIEQMIGVIRQRQLRTEFDLSVIDRSIRPDGGLIALVRKNASEREYYKIVLISEIKRQGTNDEREKEGKEKQAVGNAIERLGKNLTGIRAMLNHEAVTPFVCFGWGCDFDDSEKTVMSKLCLLNEFYPINKTYVLKRDGDANHSRFAPVSMFFRTEQWSVDEMVKIMKEVAETTLRQYLH